MNAESELLAKQKELKSLINKGAENTVPAYYFNLVGNALAKIFHLAKRPPRIVNAAILFVLVFLPGIIIAFLTGEIYQWDNLIFRYMVLNLVFYFGPIVMHTNLNINILPRIRDHIIDTIQDIEDLNTFSIWLRSIFSPRKWIFFSIYFGIPYTIILLIIYNLGVGKFVGFRIISSQLVIIMTLYFCSAFYGIYKVLTLPTILSRFKFDLYESNPANSEMIQHLVQTLNLYLYIFSGYMVILTSAVILTSSRYLLWVDILSGWVPITAQFVLNQYSFRKIIITAKWKNLRKLQGKIKDAQNNIWKETSNANIARVNRLIDLHDRISATPNSMLNLGSALSFINQLMFPLVGLLLANIDKFFNWINP